MLTRTKNVNLFGLNVRTPVSKMLSWRTVFSPTTLLHHIGKLLAQNGTFSRTYVLKAFFQITVMSKFIYVIKSDVNKFSQKYFVLQNFPWLTTWFKTPFLIGWLKCKKSLSIAVCNLIVTDYLCPSPILTAGPSSSYTYSRSSPILTAGPSLPYTYSRSTVKINGGVCQIGLRCGHNPILTAGPSLPYTYSRSFLVPPPPLYLQQELATFNLWYFPRKEKGERNASFEHEPNKDPEEQVLKWGARPMIQMPYESNEEPEDYESNDCGNWDLCQCGNWEFGKDIKSLTRWKN